MGCSTAKFSIWEKIDMKRVDYANALIWDESLQKVLMVKNGKAESFYWSFPGGGVADAETIEQAVIREVREETGFHIEIEGLYSVREVFFRSREEHALIFTFISKIIGGELMISDPDDEILEVKWMDIHQANDLMPYIPRHIILSEGQKINSAFYCFHGEV